ncbi:hypothetical protein [Hyalangium versicolor]|uniref:hypothetical protein n=1 Tax=Hyalangium versicolor TaxID=2861190 RepID=UPI001CCB8479|nr:hypothetical protein [Hyalangium versicolor]
MAEPFSFPGLARRWCEKGVVGLAVAQEALEESVGGLSMLALPPELLKQLEELQLQLHTVQLRVLQLRNGGPLDLSAETKRHLQVPPEVSR